MPIIYPTFQAYVGRIFSIFSVYDGSYAYHVNYLYVISLQIPALSEDEFFTTEWELNVARQKVG